MSSSLIQRVPHDSWGYPTLLLTLPTSLATVTSAEGSPPLLPAMGFFPLHQDCSDSHSSQDERHWEVDLWPWPGLFASELFLSPSRECEGQQGGSSLEERQLEQGG